MDKRQVWLGLRIGIAVLVTLLALVVMAMAAAMARVIGWWSTVIFALDCVVGTAALIVLWMTGLR